MQISSERNQILSRIREISANLTGKRMLEFTSEQRKKMRVEEKALLLEYVENLVYVGVSRCPICETKLRVAIDLGGIDGPWWWYNCPVALPPHHHCEHFQVFLGAMNLHDRQPLEAIDGVILGPAVPFVVGRMLEMSGVVAILSSIQTASGDTGYLISYFSESEIDQAKLHQEWRQKSYPLYNDTGSPVAMESKYDAWDFEIEHWIDNKKLHWIQSGDMELKLRSVLPCPYTNLTGTRKQQVVATGKLEFSAAPTGEKNAQYER